MTLSFILIFLRSQALFYITTTLLRLPERTSYGTRKFGIKQTVYLSVWEKVELNVHWTLEFGKPDLKSLTPDL